MTIHYTTEDLSLYKETITLFPLHSIVLSFTIACFNPDVKALFDSQLFKPVYNDLSYYETCL